MSLRQTKNQSNSSQTKRTLLESYRKKRENNKLNRSNNRKLRNRRKNSRRRIKIRRRTLKSNIITMNVISHFHTLRRDLLRAGLTLMTPQSIQFYPASFKANLEMAPEVKMLTS